MERNEFVLESKGYCLLCLKLPSSSASADPEIVPGHVESQGDVGGEEEEKSSSLKICSFQRVARYLKLNRGKIFKEVVAASPEVLQLEKFDLKGVLCGECSQLTGTISDVTLEMEKLQMKLDSLMRGLHDKVEKSEGNSEVMEEFKEEMFRSPETMLHFRMVEELRKETLDKSSSLIGMAKPRVRLERLKKADIPIPVLETETLPPSVPYVIADDPSEMEEKDPDISSIQGSYHDDDSPSTSSSISQGEAEMSIDKKEQILQVPSSLHQCKICKKIFKRVVQRERHERTAHQVHYSPTTSNSSDGDPTREVQQRGEKDEHEENDFRISPESVSKVFKNMSSLESHRSQFHNQIGIPAPAPADHDNTAAAEPKSKPSEVASLLSQSQPQVLVIGPDSDSGDETPPPVLSPVNQRIMHRCKYCHKAFKGAKYKRDHEMTVHEGIKFKCELCPATFMSRTEMLLHRRGLHNVAGVRGRPARPGTVLHRRKRQRQSGRGRGRHVRPPNIEINPPDLGEAASSKTVAEDENSMDRGTSGTQPQEEESGNRQENVQLRCERCDRPFDSLSGLRRHRTLVHDSRAAERKFECELCGKKFIQNQVLAKHRRSVHLGERFSCPKCSRQFTQRGVMIRHMKGKRACPNRKQ